MNDTNQNRQKSSMVPGVAIIGCFVVGLSGLICAMTAIFDFNDPEGAGPGLIASAIAFGLAANVVFRK